MDFYALMFFAVSAVGVRSGLRFAERGQTNLFFFALRRRAAARVSLLVSHSSLCRRVAVRDILVMDPEPDHARKGPQTKGAAGCVLRSEYVLSTPATSAEERPASTPGVY
jgi:hypothetical protein